MSFVNLSKFEIKQDYLNTLIDITHVSEVNTEFKKNPRNRDYTKDPDWDGSTLITMSVRSGSKQYVISEHCPSKAGLKIKSFTVNHLAYQIMRVIYGYDKIEGSDTA